MLRDDVSPSREVDFASAVWEARERMSNRLRIVRCAVPLGAKVRSLSSSRIHTHPVEQAWLRDDRLSVCICLGISFPFCEKYNLYVYRGVNYNLLRGISSISPLLEMLPAAAVPRT